MRKMQQLAHTAPSRPLITGPAAAAPPQQQWQAAPPAPSMPYVDPALLQQLQGMGFPQNAAARSLLVTRHSGVQDAINWLLSEGSNPSANAPFHYTTTQQAAAHTGAYSYGAPPAGSIAMVNPLNQGYQQASGGYGAARPDARNVNLSAVGVAGIKAREEQKAAATGRSVSEAFHDLTALMNMAQTMVQLAETLRLVALFTLAISLEYGIFVCSIIYVFNHFCDERTSANVAHLPPQINVLYCVQFMHKHRNPTYRHPSPGHR